MLVLAALTSGVLGGAALQVGIFVVAALLSANFIGASMPSRMLLAAAFTSQVFVLADVTKGSLVASVFMSGILGVSSSSLHSLACLAGLPSISSKLALYLFFIWCALSPDRPAYGFFFLGTGKLLKSSLVCFFPSFLFLTALDVAFGARGASRMTPFSFGVVN